MLFDPSLCDLLVKFVKQAGNVIHVVAAKQEVAVLIL